MRAVFDRQAAVVGDRLGGLDHNLVVGAGEQCGAAVLHRKEVRDMEKPGLFHADLDKGGLHPRQHAADLALVDISDNAPFLPALDQQVGQLAVFHQGDAALLGCGINVNVLFHALSFRWEAVCKEARRKDKWEDRSSPRGNPSICALLSLFIVQSRPKFNRAWKRTNRRPRLGVSWRTDARDEKIQA